MEPERASLEPLASLRSRGAKHSPRHVCNKCRSGRIASNASGSTPLSIRQNRSIELDRYRKSNDIWRILKFELEESPNLFRFVRNRIECIVIRSIRSVKNRSIELDRSRKTDRSYIDGFSNSMLMGALTSSNKFESHGCRSNPSSIRENRSTELDRSRKSVKIL